MSTLPTDLAGLTATPLSQRAAGERLRAQREATSPTRATQNLGSHDESDGIDATHQPPASSDRQGDGRSWWSLKRPAELENSEDTPCSRPVDSDDLDAPGGRLDLHG